MEIYDNTSKMSLPPPSPALTLTFTITLPTSPHPHLPPSPSLSPSNIPGDNKVYHAYNDRDGVTHDFTMNGLRHANSLLGREAFSVDDWEAIGEYDQGEERHRAFVVPRKDLQVEGVSLRQGEKVRIEESYKYNRKQVSEPPRGAAA